MRAVVTAIGVLLVQLAGSTLQAQESPETAELMRKAGVYVDWPSRSPAHSNRKLYFFMGNLYLRWDVPSNTRNYRLDILAGWKGWPAFA